MSKHAKPVPGEIEQKRVAWRDLVVLCRTCGRKRKGGFGEDGREDLRSALRQGLRKAGHGRDVRIIETGCLGVCPKRAVVAFRAIDPGRLLIVPHGRAISSLLEALDLTQPE